VSRALTFLSSDRFVMSDVTTARENRILAQLPDHVLDQILSMGEIGPFMHRTLIQHRDQPVHSIHFPLSGMLSMVTVDDAGGAVEVATVGREGIVGVTALLGMRPLPFEVMWQLPGQSVKVDAAALRAALAREPVLNDLSVRYLGSLLAQAGQNAGCNRMHDIEERAAKWLLLSRDRVDDDTFPLTQEFFAIMLGVTRPRLNLVQSTLARAGIITYSRGRVTVLDRAALEEQACDCYGVIAEELAALETPD
jgi:CRP-like cAMP-binding protein